MKKQLLNFVIFLLSVRSFGFWELDGPFGQVAEDEQIIDRHTKKLLQPIERLKMGSQLTKPTPLGDKNIHGYLCIYNKQTGYSIGYVTPINYWDNSTVVNFFLGNKDTNVLNLEKTPHLKQFSYESTDSIFYFVKEDQDLVLEGSLNPTVGTQLYIREKEQMYRAYESMLPFSSEQVPSMNHIDGLDKNLKKTHSIVILDKNSHFSGIVITNKEDRVEIRRRKQSTSWKSWFMELVVMKVKQDNPPLDFQVQLEKYFNKEAKVQYFVQDMIDSYGSNDGLSAKKLNALKFASRVGEGEIRRLKDSKILAVYGVMKNDRGQDAIIWGLAEDKKSHRTFHWITDLEDDISVLLKQ